jgi:hypothetical protein
MTGKLLANWRHDGKSYRLVATANYTIGYEDNYVVERQEQDSLGGARWEAIESWATAGISGKGDIRTILVAGIKALVDHPKKEAL